MSDKKPQPGEWWQGDTTQLSKRAFICGHDRDGCVIWQTSQNSGLKRTTLSVFLESHKHLPDCDSFEWQPETFPQCIVPDTGLLFGGMDHYYIRRTSATQYEYVHATHVELSHCHWGASESKAIDLGVWQVVTQLEAESRVSRAKPVESPDDWVTQDRVPAREAIDQRRFLYPCGMIGEWQAVGKYSKGMMHKSLAEGDTVEVRCRRRDVPVRS